MGNINNTHIEYWTKSGHKISYLFWDLKGKNRFPEQPSDLEITAMFSRCLQQIDISSYQLRAVSQFTPKYRYRFVVLHKRKVSEAHKQQQIKKLSRESYHWQIAQEVKSMESKKKVEQLQKLMGKVQLNQSTIKTALIDVDRFIIDTNAQSEFIEIRGIERLVGLLQTAIKMNECGGKISFSSQIQLLKFLRHFSIKYNREFYSYINEVTTYPLALLTAYHPLNTQVIAYSLSLLAQYAWKIQSSTSLIQVLHHNSPQTKSFLQPYVESIIESQSIINVYYNVKFINELMASVVGNKDKEVLKENLGRVKYSMVLDNVKGRLETMQFTLEKTTFISVYQSIFKYSIKKERQSRLTIDKQKIDLLIESVINMTLPASSTRNSLQGMHQQAIAKLIETQQQSQQQFIQQNQDQLLTYLSQTDRRQFNKVVFDTLTQMQKYYKLEFYLHTTINEDQQSYDQVDYQKAKALIDTRIVEHNIQTYFTKIKNQCLQNNIHHLLTNCLNKVQQFGIAQWKQLDQWLMKGMSDEHNIQMELDTLRQQVDQKNQKIKTLLKENNWLKVNNQYLHKNDSITSINDTKPIDNVLKPAPSLQQTLNGTSSKTIAQFLPLLPPLPLNLPSIPILTLGSLTLASKQKQKRQPPKQLKACNYTTIPYQKIKNSIFQQINDTKISIDENELVELFAKTVPQSLSFSLTSSRITLPSSGEQPIQLLKPDRSKNIQIILAKLRIPKGQFKKALLQCNGGKSMSLTTLQAVQKILPTQDEQNLINSFQGNLNQMGVSQRFIKQLIQVPEYASRIKSMIFSHVHEQMYHDIESIIQSLSKGFKSLKQNSRLKYAIENALAIGNYLNGQSVKGGAWGFRLETIQRLEEVKSADGKMNAALYLIKQLWKQFEYPLFQKEEIQLYQYLGKMPLSQVKQQISQFQVFVNTIQKASKSKDQLNQKDKIHQFCSIFYTKAIQKLSLHKKMFQQLKEVFGNCASYYCEDPSRLDSDQFGRKMYHCVLFISNTQKIYKLLEEQSLKSSRYRATQNSVAYKEPVSPARKQRESLINIIEDDGDFRYNQEEQMLAKTTPSFLASYKITHDNPQSTLTKHNLPNQNSSTGPKIQSLTLPPPTHIIRQSHRFSSILQIHKPSKPINELSQQQIKNQLKTIQQQSLNRAMQDVFRRRTLKFQNIAVRFSKINGLQSQESKVDVAQRISFLKSVGIQGEDVGKVIEERK